MKITDKKYIYIIFSYLLTLLSYFARLRYLPEFIHKRAPYKYFPLGYYFNWKDESGTTSIATLKTQTPRVQRVQTTIL